MEHIICLTVSVHQSHICDTGQIGNTHSNLCIPQCKTQDANIAVQEVLQRLPLPVCD